MESGSGDGPDAIGHAVYDSDVPPFQSFDQDDSHSHQQIYQPSGTALRTASSGITVRDSAPRSDERLASPENDETGFERTHCLATEVLPSSVPYMPLAEEVNHRSAGSKDVGDEEIGDTHIEDRNWKYEEEEQEQEEASERLEAGVRLERYDTKEVKATLSEAIDTYIEANSDSSSRTPSRPVMVSTASASLMTVADLRNDSRRFEEAKALEQLLQKPRYHDWCCTMLFLVQLSLIIIVLAIGLVIQTDNGNLEYVMSSDFLINVVLPFLELLAASTVCGFAAGVFTMLWFFLLSRFVRITIWTSYSFAILAIFFLAMQAILTGYYFVGITIFIVFALFILLGIVLARRIAFTIVLLRIGVVLMDMMPSIKYFALFSIIVYMAWFTLWYASLIITFQFDALYNNQYASITVFVCYFFSLFWTTIVIKNVVHTTACGVFSTWYFMQNSPHFPRRPTLDAARRTLTYSFGSLCFAALVSAVVSTARVACGWLWSDAWRALCSLAFVSSSLIQWLARYGNRYAMSYVATYGTGYLRSCKDAAVLMRHNGLDAILNDTAVSVVLLVASLLSGVLSGVLGLAMGLLFGFTGANYVFFVILTIVVGAAVNLILLALIISAVVTLFVCISEDPEVLKDTFPELYNKLASAYLEHELKHAAKKKAMMQKKESQAKLSQSKQTEATPLLAE